MIEAFQPDMYQALCDSDTDITSSKKRIHKSIDRSVTFFEKCLKRHEKSEVILFCTSHMTYPVSFSRTRVSKKSLKHIEGTEVKVHAS